MGGASSLGSSAPLCRGHLPLINGFNLAEYLTVPAATFRALVVARFVEIAMLVGIGLSAAALANTARVRRGWWVGIAAASIPLVVIDATLVGSDLEPAAFLATAALAFLIPAETTESLSTPY